MKVPMYKIVKEYHELNPNGHWFDTNTMKFFNCRLPNKGYAKGNGYYFITSECDSVRPRCYTIRRLDRTTGDIETVGPFCQYHKDTARRELAYNILNWKLKDL